MLSPELLVPSSPVEAARLLRQHEDEAKAISGGTAVVLLMRQRLIAPSYLVALYALPGLSYIHHEPGEGLRIGALTSIRDVETSPLVRQHAPVLAYAMGRVASVRVRCAATVGGNLAEADYASDPHGVLIALDAEVRAVGPEGERAIPMRELITGHYETSLRPDELITELRVPEVHPNTRTSYIKYTTRSSEDRPAVGVASLARLDAAGKLEDLRVVVTAVAETPQQVPDAEQLALGERPSESLAAEVAGRYAMRIEPLEDQRASAWYRTELIRTLVRRGLAEVFAEQGAQP